jgi:hypothetical protein
LQDIVNYFLFALNLIIFATVAFAGLAYLVKPLNQRNEISANQFQKRSLPLYDILLDFQHRDIDHWFSWIKTQPGFEQESAFELLINYLSGPIEYKGLVTRDVLKIITKFPCDGLYSFMEGFSKSALRNWNKNKAIVSFYEQSLLSLIELDSSQAALMIVSQLKETRNDPDKDIANKLMVSALSKLENLAELKHCFKQIALDDGFKVEFQKESLDLLKINDNHRTEVVIEILREMVNSKSINFLLFNYGLNTIFSSGELESLEVQELLISCFSNPDTEGEATQNLLKHLLGKDFYISQKLIFKLLNVVSPKNYERIKESLILRSQFSDTEKSLMVEQDSIAEEFEELKNNSYNIKMYNFDEVISCDPFLNEELLAMDNVIAVDIKPCLKVVYGNSKLEKLYIAKVLASMASQPLLVLDLENILEFSTELSRLDHMLAQDPSRIVFIKNLKSLILHVKDKDKRKQALKVFALIKKYVQYSTNNFIACIENKLEDLIEADPVYQSFFEEHSDVFLHSYTFDVPSMERKKGLYKSILQYLGSDRPSDLNSFDDLKDIIQDFSYFEFKSFIYKFFHDSLLTFKGVISVRRYMNLLKEKQIFGCIKDLGLKQI